MAIQYGQLSLYDFWNSGSEVKQEPVKVTVKTETPSQTTIDEALKLLGTVLSTGDSPAAADSGAKAEDKKQAAETPAKKRVKAEKPKKKSVPEILTSFGDNTEARLRKILKMSTMKDVTHITISHGYGKWFLDGDTIIVEDKNKYYGRNVQVCDQYFNTRNKEIFKLAYFDADGDMWIAQMNLKYEYGNRGNDYGYKGVTSSIDKWRQKNELLSEYIVLNTETQLREILETKYPYIYKMLREDSGHMSNDKVTICLMAPQLEQLSKAGFEFAAKILRTGGCYYAEQFNRLCQRGANMKEIFKTPKEVYSVLKNETDLQTWDMFRKLYKKGTVGRETVEEVYHGGFNKKQLEWATMILGYKWNGHPVFTWNSLIAYLGRVDFYEAIARDEALMLLCDYLRSCNVLEVKPKIDGDSLKREHDVMARNVRQKRDEIMAKKMAAKCEENQRNNYSERIFFIRAIESHEDLLKEATMQHNCVASYAQSIANGTSRIYVMRETANPDKSLITVELDGKEGQIRQKLLAYNQPIRNLAQTEFLDRWLKLVKKRRNAGAASITEMLKNGT